MTYKVERSSSIKQGILENIKDFTMAVLVLLFILLYAAALLGWVKLLLDVPLLNRLEPIIFLIVGYYFGRLPSQQNEHMLKDEINRQSQKVEAAQHAREQVLKQVEALEEKIKNASSALSIRNLNAFKLKGEKGDVLFQSIETAEKILGS